MAQRYEESRKEIIALLTTISDATDEILNLLNRMKPNAIPTRRAVYGHREYKEGDVLRKEDQGPND